MSASILPDRLPLLQFSQTGNRLTKDQLSQAAHTMYTAFEFYPTMDLYFPSSPQQPARMQWYFSNVIRATQRYGILITTSDFKAVLCLLPPAYTRLTTWQLMRFGFWLSPWMMGWKACRDSMICENALNHHHEELMQDTPHFYLWNLTVDPQMKGQRLGSRLMKAMLEITDSQQLPVYLETHTQANVGFYQQFGFHVLAAASISRFNQPYYCLLRPADYPHVHSDA